MFDNVVRHFSAKNKEALPVDQVLEEVDEFDEKAEDVILEDDSDLSVIDEGIPAIEDLISVMVDEDFDTVDENHEELPVDEDIIREDSENDEDVTVV